MKIVYRRASFVIEQPSGDRHDVDLSSVPGVVAPFVGEGDQEQVVAAEVFGGAGEGGQLSPKRSFVCDVVRHLDELGDFTVSEKDEIDFVSPLVVVQLEVPPASARFFSI